MAGSSLIFDIFGRDKGVGKVFDDVSGKAEGMKGIFSGVGKLAAGAFAIGGVIALGSALGDFIGGTLQDLQRIETINAQTAATIKSTGGAAGVSAGEISDLASSLEGLTATEGELIQEGANTLLTFTNIKNAAGEGNDVFNQATLAVTDYSRAMGTDMQSASIQVGKALNDPIKGVSALSKAGVQFTDQQKDMITAMVEAGDVAGAQKVVLGELNTQFGGSGAAYAETTAGKIELLGHAWGNFGETLLGAVAPALGEFAEIGTNAINWLTETPGMASFSGWLGGLPGMASTAASGLGGIFDILANGDFSGPLFGKFEEDSGFVDFLFRVRETVIEFLPAVTGVFDQVKENVGSTFGALGPVIATVFEALGPAIGQLAPVLASVLPMLSPLGLVFQALMPVLPQIAGLIGMIATQLGGVLGAALTQVAPLFGMLVATMSGVFIQVMPLIVQLVGSLSSAFAQIVPVVMGIIAVLVPLIATLITQLAPIFTQLVTAVLPPVIQILGMVAAAIAPLIQIIAGLLIPIIQALLPVIVTVFGVIAQVIAAAMQIVLGIIQVVTGIISGNWAQVWAGIQNILAGVWNTIVALVTGALAVIGSVISGGLSAVAGVVGSILGWIGGTFGSIFGSIGQAAGNMIGTVVGFFTGLPGKIMGALSGAASWLYGVGADIVQGLLNGVASLAGTIGNFFLSLLPGWIVGPFKAALGIASPSKVFAGFGENIGEGVVQGVAGMKGAVDDAVGSLVDVPPVGGFGASGAAATAASVGGRGAGQSGGGTLPFLSDEDRQLIRDFIRASRQPLKAIWNGREVLRAVEESDQGVGRRD